MPGPIVAAAGASLLPKVLEFIPGIGKLFGGIFGGGDGGTKKASAGLMKEQERGLRQEREQGAQDYGNLQEWMGNYEPEAEHRINAFNRLMAAVGLDNSQDPDFAGSRQAMQDLAGGVPRLMPDGSVGGLAQDDLSMENRRRLMERMNAPQPQFEWNEPPPMGGPAPAPAPAAPPPVPMSQQPKSNTNPRSAYFQDPRYQPRSMPMGARY